MLLLFFSASKVFAARKVKWLRVLYAPRPQMSLAMLVLAALSFFLLLFFIDRGATTFVSFAINFFSFLLGVFAVVLMVMVLKYRVPVFLSIYKIDKERFQAFVAVTIACLFLNVSLKFPSGDFGEFPAFRMLLLPFFIGVIGLSIGVGMAIGAEYYPKLVIRGRMFWSILTGFLLALSSFLLCFHFIPQQWYFAHRVMNAAELFWVLQVGIASGVIAVNFSELHKFFSRLYVKFLLYNPSQNLHINLFLRFSLNILLAVLPLATVLTGLLIAFSRLHVYGLAMALLMMFANIGFGVVMEKDSLNFGKMMFLNEEEKQKIQQISPSIPFMVRRFFKNIFFQKGKS